MLEKAQLHQVRVVGNHPGRVGEVSEGSRLATRLLQSGLFLLLGLNDLSEDPLQSPGNMMSFRLTRNNSNPKLSAAALVNSNRRGQSKLYVPLQCHKPSESAVTSAWASNPTNFPVPPENVTVPLLASRSSTTWPFEVFPDPASRTTSVSRVPALSASA